MRTITVLEKASSDSRYSPNTVEVVAGNISTRCYWNSQTLAIEQMKDRIAAAVEDGTFNAQMLEDFADLVREKAYQDGCDDERESFEEE